MLAGSRHHVQFMHALKLRVLVGVPGCGLIGERGASNEPNKVPLDPPLLLIWSSHCFWNWTLPTLSEMIHVLSTYTLSFYVIHSDISGGYSPSIFNAMRVAIHASKALSLTINETDYWPLTHHEAFYLATMGGAQGQQSFIIEYGEQEA